MLAGMPQPLDLRRSEVSGEVLLTVGSRVLFRYPAADIGMRNLAVVTLPGLGFTGRRVAEVFGLTEEYVSTVRARARAHGSAGLMRPRGRPPSLAPVQVAKARRWHAEGVTGLEIGRRLGVHDSTVSRLLARLGPLPPAIAQPELPEVVGAAVGPAVPAEPVAGVPAEPVAGVPAEPVVGGPPPDPEAAGPAAGGPPGAGGSARLGVGGYRSRYAGAMLLYPFLDRADAAGTFATVTGGPARRYDDLAVLTAGTVCFALGIGAVEGVKHLARSDAGVVVGLTAIPELRTVRTRLAALADRADPLAVQRAAARGLLAADPAEDASVYYVDDHFVPYAGAKPLAKGWNSKRRHAQPGRADTLVTDRRGRAVCFTSGEPAGLTKSLPAALAELRRVTGADQPIVLGFDRGGSYPVTFAACREAGADWVSYRRQPLAPTAAEPTEMPVTRGGRRQLLSVADEPVELAGYGTARQLTVYDHGAPALQLLTSLTTAPAGELVMLLRSRWRIENTLKYLAEHYGIDQLCDYRAEVVPDRHPVDNPARVRGRAGLAAAEAELAGAERALAQLLGSDRPVSVINKATPAAQRRIGRAADQVARARQALRGVPAKLPADQLDPAAQRAQHRLERRGLQMVLRLLAANAEAWLADRLDAYLRDPDEYRATTRHLLHHAGTINYTRRGIAVSLDRPDSPRVARALTLLLDELNATPTRMPGDHRPLTYRIAQP
jgi:transposase